MRFVSLVTFVCSVTFVEAKLNIWKNSSFFQKAMIDFIFPKDPNIVRVRNLEQARSTNKVAVLDFIGLMERYGYPAEEHKVTTEDGYNLLIHRIPGSPLSKNKQMKEIVFLQHGIICSSDCWILIGNKKDLAFLLADQGYDVWLGNFRGNTYCRSHVTLSPKNNEFWQFSFHETGMQDLPVMIDYVLNYTNHKTLRYIGHSMGTSAMFVLLSTRPEYNAKIRFVMCLAPIAFWIDLSPFFHTLIELTPYIKKFADTNDVHEIFSLSSSSITLLKSLCADKAITQFICVMILFLFGGSDPMQLNATLLTDIFSYYPCGTSIHTVHHFYQNIIAHDFQSYDYGSVGNYEKYGQKTPIKYDLKKINTSIALFYGKNDVFASKMNVLELYKHLPNVVLLEENPHKFFNHLDFIWATDAKVLLYDHLIEILQKFDAGMSILNA